jgi:hypothetical protein
LNIEHLFPDLLSFLFFLLDETCRPVNLKDRAANCKC